VSQEPGRLIVRFEGADAVDATLPAFVSEGWVRAVRLAESGASVVIELGPRFGAFRAADTPVDPSTSRLVMDVFGAAADLPQPVPAPAGPSPEAAAPMLPSMTAGLRTIVIDPGHGGAETGSTGPKGTLEKDLSLAIARRVKAALEARLGARILLTRDSDADVPLDARASLANNNKADLFVSIHANGSVRPSAAGAEVFYASVDRYVAGTEQPLADAGGLLMPVFGGGTREIAIVPWDSAQSRHVGESAAAARLFEAALRQTVQMNPRALQQAPLRVLVGANMPAVLLEVGYLTNAEQEDQLRGDGQGRVVQAIAEGIVRFDQRAGGAVAPPLPGTP
jgi:N-acetylmuramoyl-L-alanine amidase